MPEVFASQIMPRWSTAPGLRWQDRRPGQQRRSPISGTAADVDLDDFRGVLELTVVPPVALTQAVVLSMRAAGRGTIVNVSSGTTRRVAVGLSPYASTKFALNMLTLAARAELAHDGIDVSLLVPFITAMELGGGMFQGPGL